MPTHFSTIGFDIRTPNDLVRLAQWVSKVADSILRMLCYGELSIHPAREGTFDRGRGWGVLDAALLGTPHVQPGTTEGSQYEIP